MNMENWIAPRLRRLAEIVFMMMVLGGVVSIGWGLFQLSDAAFAVGAVITLIYGIAALVAAAVELGIVYLLLHMRDQQAAVISHLTRQSAEPRARRDQ